MADVMEWIDKNPLLTGGIVLGGGLGLLWLFGFFSSSSSANSGAANMAAAYYSAEAAQATAGTQLQLATVQATNQTAQVTAQANAAEAIAATQATAQQTIAQYGAGVATTNANDAMATSATAAQYAYETSTAHDNAMNFNAYINQILPQALQQNYGYVALENFPGAGNVGFAPGFSDPNQLAAAGFTPAQIAAIYG